MSIDDEFDELIKELTDDEFWIWVRSFYDSQFILDVVRCWDSETKKEQIESMKEIINKREK